MASMQKLAQGVTVHHLILCIVITVFLHHRASLLLQERHTRLHLLERSPAVSVAVVRLCGADAMQCMGYGGSA